MFQSDLSRGKRTAEVFQIHVFICHVGEIRKQSYASPRESSSRIPTALSCPLDGLTADIRNASEIFELYACAIRKKFIEHCGAPSSLLIIGHWSWREEEAEADSRVQMAASMVEIDFRSWLQGDNSTIFQGDMNI